MNKYVYLELCPELITMSSEFSLIYLGSKGAKLLIDLSQVEWSSAMLKFGVLEFLLNCVGFEQVEL